LYEISARILPSLRHQIAGRCHIWLPSRVLSHSVTPGVRLPESVIIASVLQARATPAIVLFGRLETLRNFEASRIQRGR
jgi:hypothetical protein